MEKKECLFSCGKINKYFIIPFICPIFCFLGNLFYDLYIKLPNENTNVGNSYDDKIKKKLYLISCSFSLNYFAGGLLYFISYIKTKTETSRISSVNKNDRTRSVSSFSITYIYNDASGNSHTLKIYSILIIISLLINCAIICNLFVFNNNVLERRLYYLILLPIFSKFILKSKLFSHQILSLCISIFGIILLIIPQLLKFTKNDIIFNILVFFSSSVYSFSDVMVKYLTHKYYLSPYLCLLIIGFFSLIIFSLGFIIYYSINNFNDFIENFKNESFISVVYLILSIILFAILNVLSYLVIYYFSPTLLMVTDLIHPIINWIISFFQNEKKSKNLDICLNSIGYFLVFFSSLIYNEIIILNFYGLNKNTKKYLEEKQKEELSSIYDYYNDDDEPNEKL